MFSRFLVNRYLYNDIIFEALHRFKQDLFSLHVLVSDRPHIQSDAINDWIWRHKKISIDKEYDNLSHVADKTDIWYGAMSTLQQRKT